MRASAAEMAKLRDAKAEAETLFVALDGYGEKIKGADTMTRVGAATIPGPQGAALNTAYNNAALLAKGESLYNLGVLNGPDLDIIRRTLTDPSQLSSLGRGPEAVQGQIDEIKKIIATRIAAKERALGVAPAATTAAAPPAAAPAEPRVIRYDAQGRRIE